MQKQELNNQDALIARNSQTGESGVVTGVNPDGSPQMEDPAKAAKFLTFDRRADILDNFLRNFAAQYKNPTLFNFFKVPADQVPTVGFAVNQMAKDPESEANKSMLQSCEVKVPTDAPAQKESTAQEQTGEQKVYNRPRAIEENSINWNNLATWGITKESLGEQNLKDMLNNRMSDLVKVTPTFGNEKYELEARLSLQQSPDGSVKVIPHFIRQTPNLTDEFHGYAFSKEDKDMLKKTGNLGRVVDLKTPDGKTIPSFVSIDRKTNELIALPASALYVRNKIGETELSPKDIAILKSGKQLSKDVTLANGKSFKTVLQVSAAEQKLEFVPVQCRLAWQEKKDVAQGEGNEAKQKGLDWITADGKIKPIGKWKGVEFTEQQQRDYQEGKTVKLENVPDKAGKPATLYIKFNSEKGRPFTYTSDPDKAKVITPAEESKAQVAVNNEGKTQESTKHLKEPLDKGQTQPKPEQKKKGPKL